MENPNSQKLTELISLRLTLSQLRKVQLMAGQRETQPSEYIRDLIDQNHSNELSTITSEEQLSAELVNFQMQLGVSANELKVHSQSLATILAKQLHAHKLIMDEMTNRLRYVLALTAFMATLLGVRMWPWVSLFHM